MDTKRGIVWLLFIFNCYAGFSQSTPPIRNYKIVDSIAKTIHYKNDLKLLTANLTDKYTSEFDKARALFIWITDNIAYDYKFVNKNKKIKQPKCKAGQDCSAIQLAWEDHYLHKVITKQKAICDGYSRLFKLMCGYAGISCSMVDGYTKSEPSQVGKMGIFNHSWNAIKIDGNYYFIDATWASGGCDKKDNGKLGKFKKHFENYFWLTPVDKLSRDHFPKDSVWVRNTTYAKAKVAYKNTPYIKQGKEAAITILYPETGLLNAKAGDTIKFKIDYDGVISKLQINTNVTSNPNIFRTVKNKQIINDVALQKQKYINFSVQDNAYVFEYVLTDKNTRYIDILFDYERMIRFKVNML